MAYLLGHNFVGPHQSFPKQPCSSCSDCLHHSPFHTSWFSLCILLPVSLAIPFYSHPLPLHPSSSFYCIIPAFLSCICIGSLAFPSCFLAFPLVISNSFTHIFSLGMAPFYPQVFRLDLDYVQAPFNLSSSTAPICHLQLAKVSCMDPASHSPHSGSTSYLPLLPRNNITYSLRPSAINFLCEPFCTR